MSNAQPTLDIPKEPAVRRAWVIYQLRLRGLSLRQLAGGVGVAPQAMSAALMSPNVHLEPAIAEALGLQVQQLFPERFDASGNRIPRTRAPERTKVIARRNVKHRAAS